PWALNVRRLRVLWWVQSRPPGGYAAFDLRLAPPRATPAPPREPAYASSYGRRLVTAGERWAENERLKISVNDDGTFEITDKANGVTYSRVAALEDVGDVGDEYNYCPPAAD